ncbi:hypothetical protein BKA65DRAFT_515783 [Rhexocercosporidium sp. MPI-PUGE-AT-0058]|nr:hypothetical protein BKA65DRAFT_515783 [Rhexocercosporidium sp. MPI-PUGE-AT-0058]
MLRTLLLPIQLCDSLFVCTLLLSIIGRTPSPISSQPLVKKIWERIVAIDVEILLAVDPTSLVSRSLMVATTFEQSLHLTVHATAATGVAKLLIAVFAPVNSPPSPSMYFFELISFVDRKPPEQHKTICTNGFSA